MCGATSSALISRFEILACAVALGQRQEKRQGQALVMRPHCKVLESGWLNHVFRGFEYVVISSDDGVPDGATIDSEGYVWITHWGGWRVGILGATYSHRLGTVNELGDLHINYIGDHLTIEAEIGSSVRFGEESLGEVWTALYFRYDGFPWNDVIYSTIALNTGVSILTDLSDFEEGRDSKGKSALLLHYLGPEIRECLTERKCLIFASISQERSTSMLIRLAPIAVSLMNAA